MSTVVLVHGAWNGKWCWARLAPELEVLGHTPLAVDLPCDESAAGLNAYAETVVPAFRASPNPQLCSAIHSAGLTIPLLPGRFPVGS